MSSHRPERLGDLIRGILARLLLEEVRDPGIGFVTLTEVRVTSDLEHAKVYVAIHGDEARRTEALAALGRAAPFLRRALGKQTRLRRVPELHFENDTALERGFRVEDLLRQIRESGEEE
jgi:ribosome-binding factor A